MCVGGGGEMSQIIMMDNVCEYTAGSTQAWILFLQAERRRLPGGTSSSSSSSLDSSNPPLGTASHIRSLEEPMDQTPPQSHPHHPPADHHTPHHSSSSMHRPAQRRTPSADPGTQRGSGVARGPLSSPHNSPTAQRGGGPNGVTRSQSIKAYPPARPASPLANGDGGARAGSPKGGHEANRDRDIIVDIAAQSSPQSPSPSHTCERQSSLKPHTGSSSAGARARVAPEDTNGGQAYHGRAHPQQGGNDQEGDDGDMHAEHASTARRDPKQMKRSPTDTSSSMASSAPPSFLSSCTRSLMHDRTMHTTGLLPDPLLFTQWGLLGGVAVLIATLWLPAHACLRVL